MITDRSSLAMPMEYVDDDFDNSVLLPSSNLLSRALRKYHWLKSCCCCYNLYFVYVHSIREDEKKGIVTLHMQGGEKGTIT